MKNKNIQTQHLNSYIAPQSDETAALCKLYLNYLSTPADWDPTKNIARESTRNIFSRSLKLYDQSKSSWDNLSQTPLKNIWIWSDLHIGHANIIHYANRQVQNVEQMNELMCANAINLVGNDDWLIFGGDVAMKNQDVLSQWLKRCPGRKMLILGNHDLDRVDHWIDLGFEGVSPVWVQPLRSSEVPLMSSTPETLWWTHYPLAKHLISSAIVNVHGHIHDKRLQGPWLNICVEHQSLAPERLDHRLARWSPNADTPRIIY